jgi:hypothetical protein
MILFDEGCEDFLRGAARLAFDSGIVTLAAPPARSRRVRRPSLESQVRQMLKAGQAAGVQIAVTVEGDKVTATPTRGAAEPRSDTQDAPPGRSLFKIRAVPKVKVAL